MLLLQQLGLHLKKDIIKGEAVYYYPIFRWKNVNHSWSIKLLLILKLPKVISLGGLFYLSFLMFKKTYFSFWSIVLLLSWLLALVSLRESPSWELPKYNEHITEKDPLVSSWEDKNISLWTREEYEKRIFKYVWSKTKDIISLPKSWPTRTNSLFYINKDWSYFTLPTTKKTPNQDSFRPLTNSFSWIFAEDNLSYYFFNTFPDPYPRIAIEKSDLPHFQLIGYLGSQDIESAIGYSNGYLVIPPYQLPVDQATFSFIPWSVTSSWYDEVSAKIQDQHFFVNNKKQYTHYLGTDKNWVYRWRSDHNFDNYLILREKKFPDFELLTLDKIQEIYNDGNLWIQIHPIDQAKFWKLLLESVAELPELRYSNNRIYVYWIHWNWSFPISWSSIKYEEKILPSDNTTYYILSDNNYYYQLLYYYEGAYYQLQKIKKITSRA